MQVREIIVTQFFEDIQERWDSFIIWRHNAHVAQCDRRKLDGYAMPIIDAMNQWGDANRSFLETVITQNPKIGKVSKSTCQAYQHMAVERKSG